jgi:hypothetical protein
MPSSVPIAAPFHDFRFIRIFDERFTGTVRGNNMKEECRSGFQSEFSRSWEYPSERVLRHCDVPSKNTNALDPGRSRACFNEHRIVASLRYPCEP